MHMLVGRSVVHERSATTHVHTGESGRGLCRYRGEKGWTYIGVYRKKR